MLWALLCYPRPLAALPLYSTFGWFPRHLTFTQRPNGTHSSTRSLCPHSKDPLTGHEVSPDEVFPNLAMYAVVEEYVAAATAREARTAREQQRRDLPHEHAE